MSSRVLVRVLLSVLAGALCGLVATCGVVVATGSASPGLGTVRVSVAAPSVRPVAPDGSHARAVLRRWDAARAGAWASGDGAALAALYAPGSVAGRRDVAMLAAWSARGARVTGWSTQVLRLQVLVERERRLVLVVTDRVVGLRAVGVGPAALPSDRPSTRRVTLVRRAGRWLVASVSPERPARS